VAVGDVTEAVVSVTSATQLADLIEHCCSDHPGRNYADGGAPMAPPHPRPCGGGPGQIPAIRPDEMMPRSQRLLVGTTGCKPFFSMGNIM
jgi:hypothetical protein